MFPGRPMRPLSNMALAMLMRRLESPSHRAWLSHFVPDLGVGGRQRRVRGGRSSASATGSAAGVTRLQPDEDDRKAQADHERVGGVRLRVRPPQRDRASQDRGVSRVSELRRAIAVRRPFAWAIIHAGKDVKNRRASARRLFESAVGERC